MDVLLGKEGQGDPSGLTSLLCAYSQTQQLGEAL